MKKSDTKAAAGLVSIIIAIIGILLWLVWEGAKLWWRIFQSLGTYGQVAQLAATALVIGILAAHNSSNGIVATGQEQTGYVSPTREPTKISPTSKPTAVVAIITVVKEVTRTQQATPSPTNIDIPPTSTPSATPIPMAQIVVHSVNVRTGPSSDYDSIGYLLEGDAVPVIGIDSTETWYEVLLPSNETAWVAVSNTILTNGNSVSEPARFIEAQPTAIAPVVNSLTSFDEITTDLVTSESASTTSTSPTETATNVPPTLIPLLTSTPIVVRSCCKYCSTGKPCGNSCISRSKTCRKGIGCACYGAVLDDEGMEMLLAETYYDFISVSSGFCAFEG